MLSIFYRRRNPFPNVTRRTTLFLYDFVEGADRTYTLVRKPSRKLSSGMAIIIVSLFSRDGPVQARLGRIVSAYPGILEFEVHVEPDQTLPLRVPADWVRLGLLESLQFGRRIRTPDSFVTPMDDTQPEADVPIASTSHAISRLRPSISMFELNVHPPQEDLSDNGSL
jgi:hypothetical protein